MIPLFKSVVSLVAALLGTATLWSGTHQYAAEECRYSTAVFGDVWSSFPPLSISESAVDVHGCADWWPFYFGGYRGPGISFSIGVREASNDALSWAYSNIFSANCYHYECEHLWYLNFSDSHIGSAVFSNLTPNTLYEVAALICSSVGDCEFGRSYYSHTSNISTTPEAPRLNGVSSTSTSITVHFQQQYYSGPAPDGHEVAVQSERTSTPQQAYTLYYDISTLNATIFVLLPNTLYTLYIRANGSQLAGTYGPWIPVQIKTLQDDLPDDVEWSISPRDTAVVLRLPQSLPYQNFATIPVKWFLPHDPSTETAEDLDVLEGGLVALEDLQPGTLYSITPGYANTTYTFKTSSQVQTSLDANNILLKWSPPFASVPESGSINGYEATVSSLPDGSHQNKFKLLGSVNEVTFSGLKVETSYEVLLQVNMVYSHNSEEQIVSLQPFYSAVMTTTGALSMEAVVNGVGGAGVMLVIVVGILVTAVIVGVIVFMIRRKTKQSVTDKSADGTNVDMDTNPAYQDLDVNRDQKKYANVDSGPADHGVSSDVVDGRYITGGQVGTKPGNTQQPYEEIQFTY